MLISFIRFSTILFCSIYSYNKLLNIPICFKRHYTNYLLFSLFIGLITLFVPETHSAFRILFLLLANLIFISKSSDIKFNITLLTGMISFAMSYMSLSLSAFILCTLIAIFSDNISFILNPLTVVLGSILQFMFIYILFRIKRLRKGMTFLKKSNIVNFGLAVCITIICLFIASEIKSSLNYILRLLTMLTTLLLALALLIWWRRKITQSYVEKLRISEVEALYKEISDKEHEIEKLHSNNRYLARIIHKDNKLIPAMELAVRNYLQNGMQMKPEDARQYGIDLLAQLQTMAADREGIIQNYHDDYRFRPQIGLYSVDAIIYYMERRAIPHSIRYEYQFDKGLKEVMLSYIDENDAIHLLSDAIENSIIATMHAIKKEIKIHIGFIQDILFMDISDTGLPFEPATYQNFGLLQHTTHKDSGGSGVGLLDIWKLKHKYKISLQIYEYPPDDHEYTKKIRFFFDRRNHFLIQSYRSQEITSLITRSDLHVFPYVEGSDFILTLDEEITEETE